MVDVQAYIKACRDVLDTLIERREPFTTNCVESGAALAASGPGPSLRPRSLSRWTGAKLLRERVSEKKALQ